MRNDNKQNKKDTVSSDLNISRKCPPRKYDRKGSNAPILSYNRYTDLSDDEMDVEINAAPSQTGPNAQQGSWNICTNSYHNPWFYSVILMPTILCGEMIALTTKDIVWMISFIDITSAYLTMEAIHINILLQEQNIN